MSKMFGKIKEKAKGLGHRQSLDVSEAGSVDGSPGVSTPRDGTTGEHKPHKHHWFHHSPRKADIEPAGSTGSTGGHHRPHLRRKTVVEADPEEVPAVLRGLEDEQASTSTTVDAPQPNTSTPNGLANGTAAAAGTDLAGGNAGKPAPARKPPTPPDKVIHSLQVMQWLAVGLGICTLVMIKLFTPSLWSIAVGAVLGLLLVRKWVHNANIKIEHGEKLNVYPGLKGLKSLVGEVPSWIHYEEQEKVEWLNRMLKQLWPFYDAAISAVVKESVEPILDQYKPAGLIRRIYFRQFSFGTAPIRIDGCWIDKKNPDPNRVVMEISFRWVGEANIAIAIEPAVGGDVTRMVPKVSDIRVSGIARIILGPFLDDVPAIGAVTVSLRKPPLIHFNLNLGRAFGGSLIAKPILAWLDPFLRNTLTDLLVWPNRMVFPIAEGVDLEPLEKQHVGLLTVVVVEAKDLKKMDTLGKSDPFVELYTTVEHTEKTSIKKRTLTPKWEEKLFVLVQEPRTQSLRVEMFDWDAINLTDLGKLNLVKAVKDTISAKEFMGRLIVPLEPFGAAPSHWQDTWYPLGKGQWSHPDGPGRGRGELRLRIKYDPFDTFTKHPSRSSNGALLVLLEKADDLYPADNGVSSDPYAKLSVQEKEQKSICFAKTLNPVWHQRFEWYNVPVSETLTIEIYDQDSLSDEFLGSWEFEIQTELQRLPPEQMRAKWDLVVPLMEVPKLPGRQRAPKSTITVKVEWVPFEYDF